MNTAHPLPNLRRRRLSLAITLLPISQMALAAPAMLPTVEVEEQAESASSIGAATVDRDAIRKLGAASSDAARLLRDVPGVDLNGAGGVSSLPAIHGLADDRLRIKVDGMDLVSSCPNHMNPPLSYLAPADIETLDVYAGIAPVSVGGDSIGGTIVATSRPPRFAEAGEGAITEGEVSAHYRSNNAARGADISLLHASERLSLAYRGSWSEAGNYRAGEAFRISGDTGRPGHVLPLDEVGSTAYETRNHSVDIALRAGAHRLEARLGYQDMPLQLFPNQRMDLLDNTQTRIHLSYLGAFDRGSLELRVYDEKVDHFMDFGPDKRFWYGSNSGAGLPCSPIRFAGDPAGTCAGGMPMHSEGRTRGGSAVADLSLTAADVLRIGGEYQRYRLDDWWTPSGGGMGPGTFWNIRDGQRDRAALFVEWEAQHGPHWQSVLGVRHEQVESDAADVHGYATSAPAPGNQIAESSAFNARDRHRRDGNWDLTALARYTPSRMLEIQLGAARKVRSPNLYERYTWSSWAMAATMNNFVGDGNGYVGDVDLQAEIAHTVSLGIDWHAEDARWGIKATPYVTRVSDYIDAGRRDGWAANRFNVLQYSNQSARLYGIDLSGHMPLASTGIGEFAVQGLLGYTDGENRDTGDDLYNIMPPNARLVLTHRHGGWDNAAEFVLVSAKDDVSAVRNEIATAGYGLLNLRASHAWQQTRIDFGIENLFDRGHDLPTGGAYLGQGGTMSMNGIPWGIAVPGMGRTAYVGLSHRF